MVLLVKLNKMKRQSSCVLVDFGMFKWNNDMLLHKLTLTRLFFSLYIFCFNKLNYYFDFLFSKKLLCVVKKIVWRMSIKILTLLCHVFEYTFYQSNKVPFWKHSPCDIRSLTFNKWKQTTLYCMFDGLTVLVNLCRMIQLNWLIFI